MKEWLDRAFLPMVTSVVNLRPLTALRNGMTYTIPIIIVGSLFFLFAHFPVDYIAQWIDKTGFSMYFKQVYQATFDVIAFWIVFAIAYAYAKEENIDRLPVGMTALSAYLLLIQPLNVQVEIDNIWTGGEGILGAVATGLLIGWGYARLARFAKGWRQNGKIPENVWQSFTSLIPILAIVTFTLIGSAVFQQLSGMTVIQGIWTYVQLPIQSLIDTLFGVLLLGFFVPFLWLFGLHGSAMVNGLVSPILQANSLANAEILASGKELTVANGGHIVTQQFLDQFMTVTGAGLTLGAVFFMMFFAKSRKYRELGKLSLLPAFFNINESIIFSTPIVMNPMMAVPFIFAPILSGLITYSALYFGFVPLFTAVQVPWTTPPILSGFLVGGVPAAILQGIVLAISFFIYFPFLKKIDSANFKKERQTKNDGTAEKIID
ncbi:MULTISPECIES: PTS sugar transporter subunit IIC [Enterococcus]|uniref:Permease IIC component n=1 Tax=Enterococcus faecium TaxID=1352 RepID=A0AAI8LLS8_ENTFC|nr:MULTISPECIES: PTS transporter subunit EIIC [Enterococcus]AII39827.1 PTS cellobiose transporter subunit IIC [Enterococcus faecium T110]AYM73842.1 PTS sugar transporter subunit IIC [Enterococcus faecium]MBL5005356.1 PTS cellobiose transporter subunit IIC [Enterococcus lactis]MBQ0860332.1 PTS sugar transporter subunit IIC [Enterococcus lactis]PHL16491.1 PTS sugar transporter subunit IIC [Enterococcus faecium]